MEVSNSKMKFDQRVYLILTGIFIAVMTYVTIINYRSHSFMYDELYTLGFISKSNSFADLMHIFSTDEVTNPPLYDIFLYFWYRIVPWGEGWLLFPNLVFFVTGLLAISKLLLRWTGNTRNVLFVFVISWINPATFEFMLYYIRSYSMMFMLSAIALLWYDKMHENESWKNIILFGIILTGLSLTHYFGAIVTFAFGIFDLFLIMSKRKKYRAFLSYIIAGVLTGSYMFMALLHRTKNIASFWPPVPGLRDIWNLFCAFLMNRYGALLFAAAVIFAVVIHTFLSSIEIHRFAIRSLMASSFVVCFTVAITFFYSGVINPEGSIIVFKYFWVLVPEILFIFAFCIDYIFKWLKDRITINGTLSQKRAENIFFSIYLIFVAVFVALLLSRNVYPRLTEQIAGVQQNRDMAEYLRSVDDRSDDIVLAYNWTESQWNGSNYPILGLQEYYLGSAAKNVDFTSDAEEAKKHERIYLWYTIFGFGAYDEEKHTVSDKVLQIMSGYELKEARENLGLLIFDKK